jgi:site-specific DNA-methyltransferase (adenine-specific)
MRTRLAIRESGWLECGELIWHKPDAGFLGSIQRPRRTWEPILWFGKTNKPYINLTANGNYSDRIGFETTMLRFRESGWPIAGQSSKLRSGQARGSDVFTVLIRDNENGLKHPCAFPVTLGEKLIHQFSKEGDLVVDPFCGSGSCLKAAANTHVAIANVHPERSVVPEHPMNFTEDGYQPIDVFVRSLFESNLLVGGCCAALATASHKWTVF